MIIILFVKINPPGSFVGSGRSSNKSISGPEVNRESEVKRFLASDEPRDTHRLSDQTTHVYQHINYK